MYELLVRPQQNASPYKKPNISIPSSTTSPQSSQTSKLHTNPLPVITPRAPAETYKQTGKDDKLAVSYVLYL